MVYIEDYSADERDVLDLNGETVAATRVFRGSTDLALDEPDRDLIVPQ